MELNEYLDLARDAELRAKTAGTPADKEAWLQIAAAWHRVAAVQAERGGVAAGIKPTKERISSSRRIV
jgi:hypothetical protein